MFFCGVVMTRCKNADSKVRFKIVTYGRVACCHGDWMFLRVVIMALSIKCDSRNMVEWIWNDNRWKEDAYVRYYYYSHTNTHMNMHLWRDLKMAVHQRLPSNLTELERICKEEWQRIPKSRCEKLVASFPKRLMAVLNQKGASTKYWAKGLNT